MTQEKTVIYNDEYIECRTKPKIDIGLFSAIGRITDMHSKQKEEFDIFDKLSKVSKPAFILFNDLKNTRDPNNNICHVSTDGLTKNQKRLYQVRIKELKDMRIICKVKKSIEFYRYKKGSYMINPYLIKCVFDPDNAIKNWNLLQG